MLRKIILSTGPWTIDEAKPLGPPGGFGAVYSGTDASGRDVAIKLLKKLPGDPAHREMDFAKSVAGTVRQCIIPILDVGIDTKTGQSCIVMERAEKSLQSHLQASGPLSETEAIAVLEDILEGLSEAGDIVHRDLKPGNVLLLNKRWQLADFGIARISGADTSVRTLKDAKTPRYAAPEQWNGVRATHATDIYALGCIAYELIAGDVPFPGPDVDDYAEQHRHRPPTVAHGSARLRMLVLNMLAKEPAARPSISQVRARLVSVAKNQAGLAGGVGAKRLEGAAGILAEETARADAIEAETKAKIAERGRLQVHSNALLSPIRDRLFTSLKDAAPAAHISKAGAVWEAKLGRGNLTMSVGHFGMVPPEPFKSTNWDVVSADIISVHHARYGRSASLFYASPNQEPYRWWEMSFFRAFAPTPNEPQYLDPSAASAAFVMAMTGVQVAHNPRPLDDEDAIERFCSRWLDLFAQTVTGELRRPNMLPEA